MSGKVGATGRLYVSGSRTVYVSSGTNCPRINVTKTSVKLKDDFSEGLRTNKILTKILLG